MDHVAVLLPKIKNIPKNTNGRLAIPALAGLLVYLLGGAVTSVGWQITLCDPIDKWRPVVLR